MVAVTAQNQTLLPLPPNRIWSKWVLELPIPDRLLPLGLLSSALRPLQIPSFLALALIPPATYLILTTTQWDSFLILLSSFFKIYLFIPERHRERDRDLGQGRSRLHAGSPTWDSIPGPRGHTLSQGLNHWATQESLISFYKWGSWNSNRLHELP